MTVTDRIEPAGAARGALVDRMPEARGANSVLFTTSSTIESCCAATRLRIGGRLTNMAEVRIRDTVGVDECPRLVETWRSAVDATHDFLTFAGAAAETPGDAVRRRFLPESRRGPSPAVSRRW